MKRQKQILTLIFVIACCFQALFIFKRVHNYPFMIFDMYSRKELPKKTSTLYTIIADKDTLNLVKLPIMQEGLLVNSLKNYDYFLNNNQSEWEPALNTRQERLGKRFAKQSDNYLRYSKEDIEAYPSWLKAYIEKQIVQEEIQHLVVFSTTIGHQHGFKFNDKKIIDVE